MIVYFTNYTCTAFLGSAINANVSILELQTNTLFLLKHCCLAGSSFWNHHLHCSEELRA